MLASPHRYPFLRLLLPLIVGIYGGDWFFFHGGRLPMMGVFLTVVLLISLLVTIHFSKKDSFRRLFGSNYSFYWPFSSGYSSRWLFGFLLSVFCFVVGAGWANGLLQQRNITFSEAETVYRVLLTEKPETKERTILCRALLLPGRDSLSVGRQGDVLLYFTKDSLSKLLKRGDELLLASCMAAPANKGNPDEFDYARYLARKGVSGIGFVSADSWTIISHHTHRSWQQIALDYREQILQLYRELGFREDEFAVLSALTVGYKEELNDDILKAYSVSGASHVLALSGLHIGFLYALLLFCFRALPDRWRGVSLLRAASIIGLLWAFAFFTGLSASVVRSVVMVSLFALSGLFGRRSFSLNTLSAAAFFMLLYRPSWLFDVGFQLSFCAVAAILLIQPRLYQSISVTNRFTQYLWGLMSVSIAAQIGTAPLVLLYFAQFSTHFLLTNIMVIPLVSLIMYGAVIMLIVTPLPVIQWGVVLLVQWLVQALNYSVRWIEQLPGASIDEVWVYPLEIVGFYSIVLLLFLYRTAYAHKVLIGCLFCLTAMGGYRVVMLINDRPQRSLVFYQVRGCPAVHCIDSDARSWLVYADSVPDQSRLRQAVSNSWRRQRLLPPLPIVGDYQDSSVQLYNRILSFAGQRVCIVNDNRWRNKASSHPLSVDYLYLCKGYNGSLKELTELFAVKKVILDTSLSEYHREVFSKECQCLGIHFISLSEKGSVCFLP